MKYRFLACMHRLDFEEKETQKIELDFGGIISTEKDILNNTFCNNLALDTIGIHDIDEFYSRPFFCYDWSSKVLHPKFNGYRCGYALLRILQDFVFNLWKVKDNNVYVFSGFLFEYKNEISDGCTFKSTVTSINTKSNLEVSPSQYKRNEINKALINVPKINIDKLMSWDSDYFTPTSDHLFKSGNASRIERASYFILEARARQTFPTKIVSYITALECLFTTSQSELSHRVSERVALLIGKSKIDKIETYKLLKKAYDVRSKIVHGSILKGANEDLKEVCTTLDSILRDIICFEYDILSKKDSEIDDYFLELLFE
jgi:hypothetical protein